MHGDLRILVAEDDPNDQFFLKRAFTKAGVESALDFVGDGQETVDYLKGEPPFDDRAAHPMLGLLLDLKMPRFTGFEVIRWVRQQPGLRRLIIVVHTNSHLPEDVNRAYDLGANSYVVKNSGPAEMEKLARELESYWFRCNVCPTADPTCQPNFPDRT